MIANFPKKKSYNPGGLRIFRFAHASDIVKYPSFYDGELSGALELLPDKELLTGYATMETLQFGERARDSENGIYYEQEITGFAPGDYVELLDVIAKSESNEFVVLVEDARGQIRLAGGYGYPLLFLADFSSGSNRSDAKGFTFSFSGNAIFRAPVYHG